MHHTPTYGRPMTKGQSMVDLVLVEDVTDLADISVWLREAIGVDSLLYSIGPTGEAACNVVVHCGCDEPHARMWFIGVRPSREAVHRAVVVFLQGLHRASVDAPQQWPATGDGTLPIGDMTDDEIDSLSAEGNRRLAERSAALAQRRRTELLA
jgi:hypothetical protein